MVEDDKQAGKKQSPARPSPRDREVLDSGQEEVFSRTEVELGRTEHASESGKRQAQPKPKA